MFDIPRSEVLRYLGYKNQILSHELENKINHSIELCQTIMRPKFVFRQYKLNGFLLENTNFTLEGSDIKRHLQGCTEVILLCATLGIDVDRKIMELTAVDKTTALVFDSAGSAAIESYIDIECSKFENATSRFSCGYGDFPLSANLNICSLLNTSKFLGVNVTKNFLLSPKKSVTAVIGIGNGEKSKPLCDYNCSDCQNEKCLYENK